MCAVSARGWCLSPTGIHPFVSLFSLVLSVSFGGESFFPSAQSYLPMLSLIDFLREHSRLRLRSIWSPPFERLKGEIVIDIRQLWHSVLLAESDLWFLSGDLNLPWGTVLHPKFSIKDLGRGASSKVPFPAPFSPHSHHLQLLCTFGHLSVLHQTTMSTKKRRPR